LFLQAPILEALAMHGGFDHTFHLLRNTCALSGAQVFHLATAFLCKRLKKRTSISMEKGDSVTLFLR